MKKGERICTLSSPTEERPLIELWLCGLALVQIGWEVLKTFEDDGLYTASLRTGGAYSVAADVRSWRNAAASQLVNAKPQRTGRRFGSRCRAGSAGSRRARQNRSSRRTAGLARRRASAFNPSAVAGPMRPRARTRPAASPGQASASATSGRGTWLDRGERPLRRMRRRRRAERGHPPPRTAGFPVPAASSRFGSVRAGRSCELRVTGSARAPAIRRYRKNLSIPANSYGRLPAPFQPRSSLSKPLST